MSVMEHPIDLDHLADAGRRLTRSVDGLHADDWDADSLLPGWNRAHVVAHLALNGEALSGVLAGVLDDEPVPMYASGEAREQDIEELAHADHADLRERLLASLTTFTDTVRAVPDDAWSARFERTPGGPTFPLDAVPLMRVREIEIHHADLGLAYTAEDWPTSFAEVVVDGMVRRLEPEPGFRVTPLDSERTWDVGVVRDEGMVVTGPVAHLAWWLTGRPPSEQVTSSRGELPTIGGW
jgi:maleylpyruvate isomerase